MELLITLSLAALLTLGFATNSLSSRRHVKRRLARLADGSVATISISNGPATVKDDKQTWLVLDTALYDGGGELWKTVFNLWRHMPVPNAEGQTEQMMLILAGTAIDLQGGRALRWRFPSSRDVPMVEVNVGLRPIDFSVGRMASAFR